MNALGGAGLLPTPLMPLVGGVAGLLFGLVAGWFATMRSGVYFSMITLALAELLHALAPHLKGVFGGEAGLSAMRMPAWGFSFGSDIEVYFLVLAWVLVSLAALYGLTRTPLGRLTLGLRENAHRLRYLGYRPHAQDAGVRAVRHVRRHRRRLQALNIEAGNYVLFDVKLSTDAVLFAYIGGVNAFLGPVLGASILTFLSQTLADITRSWLLYQGILFVLVMLFVPDGLVGLVQRAAAARARPGRLAAARRRVGRRRPAADGRHGLHGGTAATHVRPRLPLAAGPEPRRRLADHFPVRPRLAAGAVDLADSAGAAGRGPRGLPLGAGAVAQRRPGRPHPGDGAMNHDILTLTDVRKSFGDAQIIRGVNLAVRAGERHAVIGPNGAGKSTLFHLMSGSFAPTSGDISLQSRAIGGLAPERINRLGLARSFQITNVFPRLSVRENLRLAVLRMHGLVYTFWRPIARNRTVNEDVDRLLEKVRLAPRQHVAAGDLNYSEQRSLEIGMTLASRPRVILLDEPMAGMSQHEVDYTVELIKDVTRDCAADRRARHAGGVLAGRPHQRAGVRRDPGHRHARRDPWRRPRARGLSREEAV